MKNTIKTFLKFLIFILCFIYACDRNVCEAQFNTNNNNNILPHVMLLVDTNGQMEFKDNCVCTTTANCTAQCLPSCPNRSNRVNEHNLWMTFVEALTGNYSGNTFVCNQISRPTRNAPDTNYVYPHYVNTTNGTKNTNGILDSYGTRYRFGLMTADNIPTIFGYATTYQASFTVAEATNIIGWQGDYSYGPLTGFILSADPLRRVNYFNLGARSESATNFGRLYSQGSETTTANSIAQAIDLELSSYIRPYGNTSIAAMINDYEYYLNNHSTIVNDPYRECRQRIAILVVGETSLRDSISGTLDHIIASDCSVQCPYKTAIEQVRNLIATEQVEKFYVIAYGTNIMNDASYVDHANDIASEGNTQAAYFANSFNSLQTAFTEILNVSNTGTVARTIPALSSTTANRILVTSTTVLDQSQYNAGYELTSSGPFNGILERRRTICNNSGVPETQSITDADRFQVVLENRTSNRTLYTVLPTTPANTTKFLLGNETELIPNAMSSTSTTTGGNGNQPHGNGGSSCRTTSTTGGGGGGSNGGGGGGSNGNNNTSSSGTTPSETDLDFVEFNVSNVTPDHLGIATTFGTTSQRNAERTRIVNWIHGNNNARGRDISRLGDIYHSSPIVVERPEFNIPDESFNLFRQRPEVANRPSVLYVGSNDGILHAFSTRNQTISYTSSNGVSVNRTLVAGEELWGFIPPYVLNKLQSATSTHTWTVDGTPYVREIFYRRLAGQDPNGNIYHTVMILPLGKGGGAYIALDITDPFNPKFLWQFANPTMGETLGAPAIMQVLLNVNGHLEERAITMLPAGYKPPIDPQTCTLYVDGDSWNRPLGCPANGIGTPPLNGGTQNAVDHHKCWGTDGRQVYFVDPATGQLIQQFGDTVFNAPMTGGVGIYSGQIGSITTRAFMSDADGYLWRFDVSNTNPANWSVNQFADMFLTLHQTYPNVGQPSYFAPLITTNNQGQLVIIQGTGEPEYLDGTAPNMVVSYTETLDFTTNPNGNPIVGNRTNWELILDFGEQVTGPIQLSAGDVYFTTYYSGNSNSNTLSCDSSAVGKVWGVDYVESRNNNRINPIGIIETSSNTFVDHLSFPNQIMFGVSLSQQLSCTTGATEPTYDPYLNIYRNSYNMNSNAGGTFQLNALTNNSNSSYSPFTRSINQPEIRNNVIGFAGRAE